MPSLSLSVAAFRRVVNRAQREVLMRSPAMRNRHLERREQQRRDHQRALPPLDAKGLQTLEALERDWMKETSLDALAPGQGVLEDLESLRAVTQRRRPFGRNPTFASPEEIYRHARAWTWGLSPGLLDLVENYLGVPAWYWGADVRCERADGRYFGVRQWHRDVEDLQMLKLLVYLSDVGADAGPFEHLSRTHSREATTGLRYVSGFVADDALARVVPREKWLRRLGSRGTATFVDTCQLFHRASPPAATDRYSITFIWTSRHPLKTYPVPPMKTAHREAIFERLDARQRECLPPGLGN